MTMTPTDETDFALAITKADKLVFDCLWCDQGMAHMLKGYEDAAGTVPDVIALFDFGATLNFITKVLKPAIAAPAVSKVADALVSQKTATRTPRLDLVVVSHQDDDHWRLLSYLMDEMEVRKCAFSVGRIIYAGADWGATALGVLNRLATHTANAATDLVYCKKYVSSYATPDEPPGTTRKLGDIYIRTLIANTPSSFPAKSKERKNGSSAVMVVDYANERIILPGDATYESMEAMNGVLNDWAESPVQPVTLMSAPHHGSLNTASSSVDGVDSDLTELTEFVSLTQPSSVVASAGIMNKHSHPQGLVLAKLSKYVGTNGYGAHPIVYFSTTTSEFKLVEGHEKNLYTTVAGLVTPVLVADWHFMLSHDYTTKTTATGFYGACKALISVPDTSDDLMAMLEDDDSSDEDDDPIVVDDDTAARSRPLIHPLIHPLNRLLPPATPWPPALHVRGLQRPAALPAAAPRHAPPPRRVLASVA